MCYDGIGNELHYLIECKHKTITKIWSESLKPLYNRSKGIKKLSQEEFCTKAIPAILACQNDDMIIETGVLCLKIQETYQKEGM